MDTRLTPEGDQWVGRLGVLPRNVRARFGAESGDAGSQNYGKNGAFRKTLLGGGTAGSPPCHLLPYWSGEQAWLRPWYLFSSTF